MFSYGTILRKLHKDIYAKGEEVRVGGVEKGGGSGEKRKGGREERGAFWWKRWSLSKLAFWRGNGVGKRSESMQMSTCLPTSTRASRTTNMATTKANITASKATAKKNQNLQNESERLTICVNSVENSGGNYANGDNGSGGSDGCDGDGDVENSEFAVHSLSLCKKRDRNLQHDTAKADISASQKVSIYLQQCVTKGVQIFTALDQIDIC